MEPAKLLPPSRGMKLMRTPPCPSSAETALVSSVTSCAALTFGTTPEMLPLADMPDVPTLAELGLTDLVATTWWALSAPAGLKPEIADAVNRAINASFATDAVKRQLAIDGAEAKPMTPAELTDFMRSEVAKWGEVARRVGGG